MPDAHTTRLGRIQTPDRSGGAQIDFMNRYRVRSDSFRRRYLGKRLESAYAVMNTSCQLQSVSRRDCAGYDAERNIVNGSIDPKKPAFQPRTFRFLSPCKPEG